MIGRYDILRISPLFAVFVQHEVAVHLILFFKPLGLRHINFQYTRATIFFQLIGRVPG